MWLASPSLHCEMQLNSPDAINGLLIQTRPGGGAAPSPTGSGVLVLVALPFAVAFFVLIIGPCWERKKKERTLKGEHEQPRGRHHVETHKHGIVSNRHAKPHAGFFSLPTHPLLATSAQSRCRIPRTFGPSHAPRFGDDAPSAHAASCISLHALGAAHTVNGGAIAQTRGARLPWQPRACCRSASSLPSL